MSVDDDDDDDRHFKHIYCIAKCLSCLMYAWRRMHTKSAQYSEHTIFEHFLSRLENIFSNCEEKRVRVSNGAEMNIMLRYDLYLFVA